MASVRVVFTYRPGDAERRCTVVPAPARAREVRRAEEPGARPRPADAPRADLRSHGPGRDATRGAS